MAASAFAVPLVGFAMQEAAGQGCLVEIHDQSGNLPDGSTLCQVASGKKCTFSLQLCRNPPGCVPARGKKTIATTGDCHPRKLKITKAQSGCGSFVGIKVGSKNKGKKRGVCTIRVGAKSRASTRSRSSACRPAAGPASVPCARCSSS